MNKFSRIGFILAAAGSAVGLGNIWRFPYITGEYGGGAFIIVYLLAILFIGLTVFLAEAVIGQNGQSDVSTSFVSLSKTKNENWKFAGFMVATGLIILSFYSVVLGWILDYVFTSFSALPTEAKVAGAAFEKLISDDIGSLIVYHTLIAGTVVFIVLKGIKEGIEKNEIIPNSTKFIKGLFDMAEGMFISSIATYTIENLEKEINDYIDNLFDLIEVKK